MLVSPTRWRPMVQIWTGKKMSVSDRDWLDDGVDGELAKPVIICGAE